MTGGPGLITQDPYGRNKVPGIIALSTYLQAVGPALSGEGKLEQSADLLREYLPDASHGGNSKTISHKGQYA
jgi:hypothetical protein